MMKIKTPGVYIEETALLPPSVAQVETSIPSFIGYTEKAVDDASLSLTNKPRRIVSLAEYEHFFGGALIDKRMKPLKKVNVTALNARLLPTASPYLMYHALNMFFANGGGACYIVSVGNYSNTAINKLILQSGLNEVAKCDEVTLIVFPDAMNISNADDYYLLHKEALHQCKALRDRFVIMDVWMNTDVSVDNVQVLRDFDFGDTDCLKFGAVYYPRIYSSINGRQLLLPASSAVAGVYAQVDKERGVWKAPANVSLSNVIRTELTITDAQQSDLNTDVTGKSVNAIRAFTGKGTVVWGARTLAGNDNEWRYIPVRRFFNMVEESIKKATLQFVFEPNNLTTWVKIKGMVENFCLVLWRQGAMQGAKPEHAYFVKIGLNETMTQQDVAQGRMIVEIGLAVVRPAEFIIVRIAQKMSQDNTSIATKVD